MAQVQVLAKYTMVRYGETFLYTPDFEITAVGAVPTAAEQTITLDALEDFWDQELAPLHDTAVDLRRMDIQSPGSPPSWHGFRIETPGSHPGTVVPAPDRITPNNLCLVTSFYGTVPGRSRQGRVYQMLSSTDAFNPGGDPNYVIGGYASAQNAAWLNFNSVMNTSAPTQAPFHNVWSDLLPGGTPITAYVTGTRVDTQRRRLPRAQ